MSDTGVLDLSSKGDSSRTFPSPLPSLPKSGTPPASDDDGPKYAPDTTHSFTSRSFSPNGSKFQETMARLQMPGTFPSMAAAAAASCFPSLPGMLHHPGLQASFGGMPSSTLAMDPTAATGLTFPKYLDKRRRRSGSASAVSPKMSMPDTPSCMSSAAYSTSEPASSTSSTTSSTNGDAETGESSAKRQRTVEELRDEMYWDRRKKNNEAAKRSRDSRRFKEEEIALRSAFLEQENLQLRAQVAILKSETNKLHFMLFNS